MDTFRLETANFLTEFITIQPSNNTDVEVRGGGGGGGRGCGCKTINKSLSFIERRVHTTAPSSLLQDAMIHDSNDGSLGDIASSSSSSSSSSSGGPEDRRRATPRSQSQWSPGNLPAGDRRIMVALGTSGVSTIRRCRLMACWPLLGGVKQILNRHRCQTLCA